MTFLNESYVTDLKSQIQSLEESQYLDQKRLHLVPPHYVLINPESQAEYDQLIKKDRRRQILEKGFLTYPEGQMVEENDNLLAVVNEQVFQKPWSKLDLEFQINRIFVYLNNLVQTKPDGLVQSKPDGLVKSKSGGLVPETLMKIRKLLINACFRKELGDHQVIYDCQRGHIQQILGLDIEKIDLKILEKPPKSIPVVRVSEVISTSETRNDLDSQPKVASPIVKIKTRSLNPTDSLPMVASPLPKKTVSVIKKKAPVIKKK